eukprot:16296778-Heterocapsa_arctica.AAC.1
MAPGPSAPPVQVGLPETSECIANMGSASSGQSAHIHLPAPPRRQAQVAGHAQQRTGQTMAGHAPEEPLPRRAWTADAAQEWQDGIVRRTQQLEELKAAARAGNLSAEAALPQW